MKIGFLRYTQAFPYLGWYVIKEGDPAHTVMKGGVETQWVVYKAGWRKVKLQPVGEWMSKPLILSKKEFERRFRPATDAEFYSYEDRKAIAEFHRWKRDRMQNGWPKPQSETTIRCECGPKYPPGMIW